ncbi:MAG: alkaline phosphatase D family protein [Planctomycetota bacterium]
MRCYFAIVALLFTYASAFAQHDGARDSVRLIADGKYDQVDKTLEKKKPFAGDAESAFVRMLSFLAQDQLDEAWTQAKQALDAGLPPERLIVGPRPLLEKLNDVAAFVTWREASDLPVLIHGPMVGNVTATSANLWVRTSREAVVVAKVENGSDSPSVQTQSGDDFTTVLTVDGLEPDRSYKYSVEVDGETSATGSFRTFPNKGDGGKFSVGFGGGAGYVPEWESMWDNILSFQPHAFLMLGDNVYIDKPKDVTTQHYCYYRRQSRPEWKRFTSNTAIFSIWDDHDFGTNDCVPGPEIDEPGWKQDVWKVFRQNWANPGYGMGSEQPGCWYDFSIGDVQFIMLDGRYYRDLRGGSMLGPVQKKWLLETLNDSTATFKVITSPVPFTAGIKKGSRDPWDGFPEEREEIFQHIERNKIEGVFLVAADRHRTDLRVTKRPGAYDLYEFESSRLTNHHTHPVVKTDGLIWGFNQTCSFGLMSFDTTGDDPQVEFRCIGLDGEEKETFTLKRSQLSFPNSN